MQSRGDKTRVVCSRGRSRTLHAHVSYMRRELHPHSPPLSHLVLVDVRHLWRAVEKNRVCLQREILGPRVHPPRKLAHATEIFVKCLACICALLIIVNDSFLPESIPSITVMHSWKYNFYYVLKAFFKNILLTQRFQRRFLTITLVYKKMVLLLWTRQGVSYRFLNAAN